MTGKRFDIVVLGATGYTGRQVVRALKRRAPGGAWTVAGRDRAKLEALAAPNPPLVVDLGDRASLDAMTAQAKVVVNLAGPCARTAEAAVQACIANGAHHLDLSGETFWVRQMIERHHEAARASGSRIVTGCGYEALPFDLATPWAATRLALRHREPCRELKAPFVNPPAVLRSVELIGDASVFAPDFRYHEATAMAALVPRAEFLPHAATLPLQWAAAAALAAPLANLAAAVAGPLQFQRDAMARLIDWIAPASGTGPSDEALDQAGSTFDVYARGAGGARWRGRVEADGHPGYRSTAEVVASVALGLADGSLGRTPHSGVVPPAAGLGIEAVDALAAAGVRFVEA